MAQHPQLKEGTPVHVKDGPWTGCTGTVVTVPPMHVLVRTRDRGGPVLALVRVDHLWTADRSGKSGDAY